MPTVPLNFVANTRDMLIALFVQLVLVGGVGLAILLFSRRRHRLSHTLIALALGISLGWVLGLVQQVTSVLPAGSQLDAAFRRFFEEQLIFYVQLHSGTITSFLGLLTGWLLLELIAPRIAAGADSSNT
ncbi:MAG: hypothetical protein EXS16_20985 [Gemmataceae bacterium]|nr:hypothetical protein [Gemmataceae bacterium]